MALELLGVGAGFVWLYSPGAPAFCARWKVAAWFCQAASASAVVGQFPTEPYTVETSGVGVGADEPARVPKATFSPW
jgi:hypothetical protein